jgi:hypothetical protein
LLDNTAHADFTYSGPLVNDNTTNSSTISQDILLQVAAEVAAALTIADPDQLDFVEDLRPSR